MISSPNPTKSQVFDIGLDDSIVVYIEKYVFNEIDKETVIRRFQSTRSCEEQLFKKSTTFQILSLLSNLKLFYT